LPTLEYTIKLVLVTLTDNKLKLVKTWKFLRTQYTFNTRLSKQRLENVTAVSSKEDFTFF
jgi:hypothetical protein